MPEEQEAYEEQSFVAGMPMMRVWILAASLALITILISAGTSNISPIASTQSAPPPPTTIVNSCTTSGCHTEITNQKFMHAPVAELKCLDCHEYAFPEEHLFVLTKPNNELCIDCHKPSKLDRVIHKPIADGDCLSCHDPHGSEHPTILRKALGQDLCLDCHTEDYSKHKFVHGPVAVGACVVCHESHSSSFENLLISSPDRLCLDCHDELTPSLLEKKHRHKPMEEGCVSCHDPHASDELFQLNASVPTLCIACHDWFESALETAPVIHKPTMDPGGCTECHNPHFSPFPKLQKYAQPDLCFKCHDKPIKMKDGRVLTDMKTFLEENPDHHGPIREGSCTMCHHPHASQDPNLLLQAYPPEFYAPFSIERYELCFSCHQPDLVTDEQGTGLTKFRQGDQNLHWVHVNREKGRTCRACHEVHASKRPAHIRESVPFGSKGWLLDINFTQLPDGGSCAPACHKVKEYRRSGPLIIDNALP